MNLQYLIMPLLIAILSAFVVLIIYRLLRNMVINSFVKKFKNKYSSIKVGLSKREVIELMGNNYVTNFENGYEVLIWKCHYTSHNVKISFKDDLVNAYQYF